MSYASARSQGRSLCLLPSLLVVGVVAVGCGDDPKNDRSPLAGTGKQPQQQRQQQPSTPKEWVQPVDPTLEQLLASYDGVDRPDINVLLISLDSCRRDFFSCYGHKPKHAPDEKTSPNIDRLAEEGVVLEDYYSTTSWTLPGHMGMLTGQPDLIHGVEYDRFALDPSRPTIAHVLQKVGYATAGFYTGPYCHPRFGFDRGMDRYEDAYKGELKSVQDRRAAKQAEMDRAVLANDRDAADAAMNQIHQLDRRIDTLSHKDMNSDLVCKKSMEAINAAEKEGKPWFVFAHYFDPHYDYIPPAPFDKKFDPDYDGTIDGKNFFRNPEIGTGTKDPRLTLRNQVCSPRDLEHVLSLYEGEIAYTDYEIGKMLDELRERGILDKTLVIVTADHGEEFFEHGGIGHRSTLFQEQLAVPMVMRLPDVLPAGKRVNGLASQPDIMPTVLDVLGLPTPGPLNGKSMMPLIDGSSDGSDRWVLGRLYQRHPMTNVNGPKLYRNTMKEVFYTGDLKLTRWRRWLWPMDGCPEERAAKTIKLAEKQLKKDTVLRWVDLKEHPGEQPEEFVKEFDSPAAAAALKHFQDVYADLSAQPNPVAPSFGGKTMWTIWQVPENYQQTTAADRRHLLFPPPGK